MCRTGTGRHANRHWRSDGGHASGSARRKAQHLGRCALGVLLTRDVELPGQSAAGQHAIPRLAGLSRYARKLLGTYWRGGDLELG